MNLEPAALPAQLGRTAVVTGGNSGIGFFTARGLAQLGARVVVACRDVQKGKDAVDRIRETVPSADVEVIELDLSCVRSVRSFAEGFDRPLDLLINNAGVMAPLRFTRTADGFELQFGTNHLGHFMLTGLLMDRLLAARSARVVTVASLAHRRGTRAVLTANGDAQRYSPKRAYSQSKLANLLFAAELQRQVVERGLPLSSTAAHPGLAATGLVTDPQGLGSNRFVRTVATGVMRSVSQSAEAGAQATLYAATAAEAGSYSGPRQFFETRGVIGPAQCSPLARDPQLARALWRVSEDLTGLRYRWPGQA